MRLDTQIGDDYLHILKIRIQLSGHKHNSEMHLHAHIGYDYLHILAIQIQSPVYIRNSNMHLDPKLGTVLCAYSKSRYNYLRERSALQFSFWVRTFCWVCEFLFGCWSSYWGSIFLMSLLSGSRLSVGFVISCLGVCLPGRRVGFECSCLGAESHCWDLALHF